MLALFSPTVRAALERTRSDERRQLLQRISASATTDIATTYRRLTAGLGTPITTSYARLTQRIHTAQEIRS